MTELEMNSSWIMYPMTMNIVLVPAPPDGCDHYSEVDASATHFVWEETVERSHRAVVQSSTPVETTRRVHGTITMQAVVYRRTDRVDHDGAVVFERSDRQE